MSPAAGTAAAKTAVMLASFTKRKRVMGAARASSGAMDFGGRSGLGGQRRDEFRPHSGQGSRTRAPRLGPSRRRGDAFQAIVEPHRPALHAHCYRMLGSVHDADDALQDRLLRARRGLPRFEGRSSLRSWLYPELVLPFIVAGVGVSMAIPSAQNSVVGSVATAAVGKAAGTNSMMRELGGVFGIAVLVAVFAGAGSYAYAVGFIDGCAPAMAVGAALSLAARSPEPSYRGGPRRPPTPACPPPAPHSNRRDPLSAGLGSPARVSRR